MNNIKIEFKDKIEIDISIQNGIFKNIDEILSTYPEETNFIIITDQNVIKLYADEINSAFKNQNYNIITSIIGEQAKDISNIYNIYSDLLSLDCNKSSCLVALGGGVIGDITGFIAATFMRGIQYINIPTSLLAMVDSSIGGKTGINLVEGKNLVGSIYHPANIIIDPLFLKTLPSREYNSGLSEIIKYGLILDKNLYNLVVDNFQYLGCNNDSELMNNIINRCVELKSIIVEKDVKDENLRNILNFGHTIGHALESYFGYKYMNHGEAVAYGMLYASQLSNLHFKLSDADFENINNLISRLDLPPIKELDINKLINYMKSDKKNINKELKFILLDSIGNACITSGTLTYKNIKKVLEEYEYISD